MKDQRYFFPMCARTCCKFGHDTTEIYFTRGIRMVFMHGVLVSAWGILMALFDTQSSQGCKRVKRWCMWPHLCANVEVLLCRHLVYKLRVTMSSRDRDRRRSQISWRMNCLARLHLRIFALLQMDHAEHSFKRIRLLRSSFKSRWNFTNFSWEESTGSLF